MDKKRILLLEIVDVWITHDLILETNIPTVLWQAGIGLRCLTSSLELWE